MKRSTKVASALVAIVALLSAAAPAYAFTPTLSEVRYIPGADPTATWSGLALSSDAKVAVATGGDAYIVDVAADTSTVIPSGSFDEVAMDETSTFAYVSGSNFNTGVPEITKIDLQSKSAVATWSDVGYTLRPDSLIVSPDGSTLYASGRTGFFPNWEITVATIDTSTGAIAQYTTGVTGQTYRSSSLINDGGELLIAYSSGLWAFATSAHTFANRTVTSGGTLQGCDFANGVGICAFIDGAGDYVALVDSSGTVGDTLTVDNSFDPRTVTLTPDGSAAYVFGSDSNSQGVVEEFLTTPLSRGLLFPLSFDYDNGVAIAPLGGQMWFYTDYFKSYNGGYQVVQYAEPPAPELPNTGVNSAAIGMYFALSGLLLTAGAITLLAVRRRHAQA